LPTYSHPVAHVLASRCPRTRIPLPTYSHPVARTAIGTRPGVPMPHHHADLLHTAMRQAQTAGYGVLPSSPEQGMPNTFMVGARLPKIKHPEKWNSMLPSANLMAISTRHRCGILFLLFCFVFGVFHVRHRPSCCAVSDDVAPCPCPPDRCRRKRMTLTTSGAATAARVLMSGGTSPRRCTTAAEVAPTGPHAQRRGRPRVPTCAKRAPTHACIWAASTPVRRNLSATDLPEPVTLFKLMFTAFQ
jgi:hypothetical protein